MSERACAMSPLIEARRDGRLGEREIASLERHLASCAGCAALAADLEHLARCSRAPMPPASPLDHQRGRLRLLRELAGPREAAPRRGGRRAWGIAAAAVLAAAVVGVGFRRGAGAGGAPPAARTAAPAPPAAPAGGAAGGGRYTRSVTGGVEVVSLERGSVAFAVRRLAAGERFLVRTRDAEVEVDGTRFHVVAEDHRLRRIGVIEGTVEVRYAGQVITLRDGETFEVPAGATTAAAPGAADRFAATDEPAAVAEGVADAPAAATAPGRLASPRAAIVAPSASPMAASKAGPAAATTGTAPPPPATGAASPAPAADSAFADGVGLVDRGDYGAAAERLDAFARAHPTDARSEDAAFLAIVALQRAGRADAAREAARAYLTRYPGGYRRAEAEAIRRGAAVRDPPSTRAAP